MIRTTRLCLLGKNYCNFPLFTKRALILPKETFAEFNVAADKDERPAAQEQLEKKLQSSVSQNPVDGLQGAFGQLKYSYLRSFLDVGQKNTKFLTNESDFLNKFSALPAHELIKVLKLIAESNNRPIQSIKSLCGVLLSQQNCKYTVKECADLLYSLSKLSYIDYDLIRLVADRLLELDGHFPPKTAGFMLYSLADLRFRDCELLDRLLKYVLSSSHSITTLLHCLRAVSLLNYSSSEVDEIIQKLSVLKEVDFLHSKDYVNFVWGCVLLNKENSSVVKHISNILSESCVTRLVNSGMHTTLKWKLLNINGAAKHMVSYNGPYLNSLSYYKAMSLVLPNRGTPFLQSVLDVLSHVVPKSGFVKALVNTGAGFYLDIEYNENVSNMNDSKYSKRGIVLLHFRDICSDGTLTGISNFKLNLLTSMGYELVTLRFSEYPYSDPLSGKIDFMRKKLNATEIVPKDAAESKKDDQNN